VKHLIFVIKSWTAYKDQLDRFGADVFEGMFVPAWNVYGISGANLSRVLTDCHQAGPGDDIINLLEIAMMVRRNGTTRRKQLFGKTALSYG